MSERRLGAVLTKRFSRLTWTALAGYALLVVVVFALAAEAVLRRSLEHTADVTQSLIGAYGDSTGGPGSVMPAALADQLLDMGGRVVITRTTKADGMMQVYFLSPGMPTKRVEGIPASASPDDVRRILVAAIAQRAHWRYRVLHRASGAFDIYVVASREPSVVALLGLVVAAALLLPVAAFGEEDLDVGLLHLLVELVGRSLRQSDLARLGERGVNVEWVEDYACRKGLHTNQLVLGYGALEPDRIRVGVQRLAKPHVQILLRPVRTRGGQRDGHDRQTNARCGR